MNLALYPQMVNMDKAVNEKPRKHPTQVHGIILPLDTVDVTSSEVFGKSTTASAEKGRKVFEAIVDELVKHVNRLKAMRIEDLTAKPRA